ncbi:methyltransferase [Methylocapsa polymorpha]|uniref:Methyltransferase n=1 Tax=Methylocapsa polymorpha TaxID=3080828 RepID=A0ABZ0HTC3_9HYPH|nr:methyltransferase [Methylocapsa sp. RX1]
MTTAATPEKIFNIGFGFWSSKVLLSAVELGVFTELAKGPLDLASLAHRIGLHDRAARDFLDALVALKLLDRGDGLYSNSAETDLFLDRAKPSYIGGLLEMANTRLYSAWGALTEALKTGKPQNESKDSGDLFAALYADPNRLRSFLAAMSGVSAGAAQAIAAKFPWKERKSFVDVGAAQGMVTVTLARSYPHLAGTGFDLPQVQPVFEEFAGKSGVLDRVVFRGGNFFADPLPTADVIIMGHILHDWDLTQKRMLLAKAYDALPKGGALIVYEAIIDDERRQNAFGLLMSLNMLIETSGGFDFTGADCQAWMREAGFAETRVEPLVGPDSMVIGVK